MKDKNIVMRIRSEVLDELDKKLLREGYSNRSELMNEWIRNYLKGGSEMKNYYLIVEGTVFGFDNEIHDYTDETLEKYGANDDNSVIAYSGNKENALKLAEQYDNNEIAVNNIWCQYCNKSHSALTNNQEGI